MGGVSHGSGMVDLLYSSLLFRLIWVSLDMICDSGGCSCLGLDFLLCLGFSIGFGFRFMSWFVWPNLGPGSDSGSDPGSGMVPDSGAGSGSDSVPVPGPGPGSGSVPVLGSGWGSNLGSGSGLYSLMIVNLWMSSLSLLSLIRRASLTCLRMQVGSLLITSHPNCGEMGSSSGWDLSWCLSMNEELRLYFTES